MNRICYSNSNSFFDHISMLFLDLDFANLQKSDDLPQVKLFCSPYLRSHFLSTFFVTLYIIFFRSHFFIQLFCHIYIICCSLSLKKFPSYALNANLWMFSSLFKNIYKKRYIFCMIPGHIYYGNQAARNSYSNPYDNGRASRKEQF